MPPAFVGNLPGLPKCAEKQEMDSQDPPPKITALYAPILLAIPDLQVVVIRVRITVGIDNERVGIFSRAISRVNDVQHVEIA